MLICEKCGSKKEVELRDIFYVDWYGNVIHTNDQEYMCSNC
jgi:hypothetical protein